MLRHLVDTAATGTPTPLPEHSMRLLRLTMTRLELSLLVCFSRLVFERDYHSRLFAALKKAAEDAEAARKNAEESAVRQLQACFCMILAVVKSF